MKILSKAPAIIPSEMPGRKLAPPLLDKANATFIQGGVSIVAASRTRKNVPVTARAVGCRVSPDRRTVTLLLPKMSAHDLLDGIRVSKKVAAVFCLPSTHETIQLKGTHAVIGPASKADVNLARRYDDAFVAVICPLGYAEDLIRALVWFDPADLITVTFRLSAAFLQTPGPRAGEPLKHAHAG